MVATVTALALGGAALADHKAQEVNHDNDHAWKIQTNGAGVVTFVFGPPGCATPVVPNAGPAVGTGSVQLTAPNGAADSAQLRNTRYGAVPIDDIIALEYWTCAFPGENNGQQWPYIILDIDNNGDNVRDDLIFFEPAYQDPLEGNPNVFECPNQGEELYNVWQRWDAKHGCWWSLFNPAAGTPGVPVSPANPGVKSLGHYVSLFPDARIINLSGNLGGVRLVQGIGDAGLHQGYVDRLEIATKKVVYNFEAP